MSRAYDRVNRKHKWNPPTSGDPASAPHHSRAAERAGWHRMDV